MGQSFGWDQRVEDSMFLKGGGRNPMLCVFLVVGDPGGPR